MALARTTVTAMVFVINMEGVTVLRDIKALIARKKYALLVQRGLMKQLPPTLPTTMLNARIGAYVTDEQGSANVWLDSRDRLVNASSVVVTVASRVCVFP